ncbi:MAG: leucine-rich repeat domain-containing protein, partial [Clostridia bacterium]|nr:leucine-rich repeat domain-containing protein [Clostridia bacterium]
EVNADGNSCTITGMGTCTDVELYIPEYIDGYKVTVVKSLDNENDFKFNLTYVYVPTGIVELGNELFYGTASLKNVSLPNSLKKIGNEVFYMSAIEKIEIPDSVEYIGDNAFAYSLIKEIKLSKSLKSISGGMFDNCDRLSNLTIPNSVEYIGNLAFSGSGIVVIYVPNSITSMGLLPFSGCEKMTDLYFGGTITEWETLQDDWNAVSLTFMEPCNALHGTDINVHFDSTANTSLIATPVSRGLEYVVNDDGITCTVVGMGTCTDTELHIPDYIYGYKVTGVNIPVTE